MTKSWLEPPWPTLSRMPHRYMSMKDGWAMTTKTAGTRLVVSFMHKGRVAI